MRESVSKVVILSNSCSTLLIVIGVLSNNCGCRVNKVFTCTTIVYRVIIICEYNC